MYLLDKKFSKYEILCCIICYIRFLENVLEYQSYGDVKCVKIEQEVSEDWNRVYEELFDDESLYLV